MAIRILITDDSVFMRSAIGRMLEGQPDFEIVGKARHGLEAIELAKQLQPDVITLDIEMPQMDGLTALRRIMREAPTRVLMCSTLTTQGSRQSLQALRLGAADVIPKETSTDAAARERFFDDLIVRIRALGEHPHPDRQTGVAAPPPAAATPGRGVAVKASEFDLLCIASSTGGPPVLETIVASLPSDLAIPVVIAQHMPRIFTESMSRRLDEVCPLPVVHAEDRQQIEAGTVYIAPGGSHTHLERRGSQLRLRIGPDPVDALYMPSADVLFETAAKAVGKRTLAVILTGIGSDGVIGAEKLHRCGAPIYAQEKRSCVVYGMPKAVTEAGFATASLTPDQIAEMFGKLTQRAAA